MTFTYIIAQLPVSNDRAFMPYKADKFVLQDYVPVWQDTDQEEHCEDLLFDIFMKFNSDQKPEHYVGHSLSVSDIVAFYDDQHQLIKAFYCNPVGWEDITRYFFDMPINNSLQIE